MNKHSFLLILILFSLVSCHKGNMIGETPSDNPTIDSTCLNFLISGSTFNMIFVDGGTFLMGATDEQGNDAFENEFPIHKVTLSDFYIGSTEVTQSLWESVMGSNPSHFVCQNCPVENITWLDCQNFIDKLNQLLANQLNGMRFSLPSEAQWEYAARGGSKSESCKYSGSNNISNIAWYEENSNNETHQVAQKQSNELNIYDMSGNVWEWCYDWFANYGNENEYNPTGPSSGYTRVCRGGSWYYYARGQRVSHRCDYDPELKSSGLGLRLVLQY